MSDSKELLSVIIPAFNEEANIENTVDTVFNILDSASINCEIIFISDGSTDDTFKKIEKISKIDNRVRGIEFTRNFGKEAAILAGLSEGVGDCFAVMDCDLQHPPESLIEMYGLWKQGYDIVEGIKNSRGRENILYKKFSNIFYSLLSKFTGFSMADTSDFKLIDKKVAKVLCEIPERKTFFRALTFWTGFKSCNIKYDVGKRIAGETKWNLKSLIKYAVSNIISFSSSPLNLVTYMGISALIFGLILSVHTLIKYLFGNAVEGFTTVILIILFMSGCILIGLGIMGNYMAAMYDEIKSRPRYIVKDDTKRENTYNAK